MKYFQHGLKNPCMEKIYGYTKEYFLISEECKVLKSWPKVKVPNHALEVLEELKKIS